MMNSTHNHDYILPESHSTIRKIAITQKIQNTIVNQTRSDIKSKKIISFLRLNIDEKDPIIKSQNVYNVKSRIKSEALESITSTQTLIQQLHDRQN